jgi:hypothetical protein
LISDSLALDPKYDDSNELHELGNVEISNIVNSISGSGCPNIARFSLAFRNTAMCSIIRVDLDGIICSNFHLSATTPKMPLGSLVSRNCFHISAVV